MRTAQIHYIPSTSEEYPWNVALYDSTVKNIDGGYIESVGASDHSEAIAIADQWVNYSADHWTVQRVS